MKIIFTIYFLLITFYSCSQKEEGERTIKFWAMGSEAEYVTKLVPEFEKEIPE
jgi:ABC-type glycerol-3-phosphate transport system substrate-binding protein